MNLKYDFQITVFICILFPKSVFSDCDTMPIEIPDQEDFYAYFIREAPLHAADYDTPYAAKDIEWLDSNLLDQASKFVNENFPGVISTLLYTQVVIFSVKTTSSVLLTTRGFCNSTQAHLRILKTMSHVREWFISGKNILDPNTNAYKSLEMIRERHKSASELSKTRHVEHIDKISPIVSTNDDLELTIAIQKDLAYIDIGESPDFLHKWDGTIPVGQFDLGIVQFWFFSHALMWPQTFGILRASKEDLKAYVHFWAVIGRVLGLQDRFNVALNLPPTMYKKLHKEVIVANLKSIDVRFVSLMRNVIEGLSIDIFIPGEMKLKCLVFAALKNTVDDFIGANIVRLMMDDDKDCLQFISFLSGMSNQFGPYINFSVRAFTNWLQQELQKNAIKEF